MSFKKGYHESRPKVLLQETERLGNKLSLNLHESILKGLKASTLTKPNKLQLRVLPSLVNSYYPNLVLCASARSGKTVCAVIGILDQLSKSLNRYTSAIMLAPTYEIAETIFNFTKMLSQFCHVSLHFIAKDKSAVKRDKSLKEIFVGTPEKIMDFCRSSCVDFKKVDYLLVDEADCLSNPKKYFKDIVQIYQNLSAKSRTILCTCSMNNAIQELLDKHIKYYEVIEVENDDCAHSKQIFLVCDEEEKINALLYLLTMKLYKGKSIVFCERKDVIASLSRVLLSKEIVAGVLSGELTLPQRRNILEKLKDGELEILITTRSFLHVIDASNITKLINYDQVLNEKYNIDINTYKKRHCVLSKTNYTLVVNFIEKKWESHVFRTKDVMDERNFYTGIEIIGNEKLETYF